MNKRWTDEEVELLLKIYPTTSNSELLDIFKGKTRIAIYKKANKLNLVKNNDVKHTDRSESQKTGKKSELKTSKGYILEYCPNHPRADKNGYVMQHILVFEKSTGIVVPNNCVVHHINGNKTDNSPHNLCLMERGLHTVYHNRKRVMYEKTKQKISEKAKLRLKNKENHPFYKDINVELLIKERKSGKTVKEICESYKISKSTYYKKLEEYINE